MNGTLRAGLRERLGGVWMLQLVPPAQWSYFTALRRYEHIDMLTRDDLLTDDFMSIDLWTAIRRFLALSQRQRQEAGPTRPSMSQTAAVDAPTR